MKRFVKYTLVMVGIAATLAASVQADDNAGNYATWDNGNNLGSGFGAWAISDGSGTHFLFDSTSIGGPGANINTSGQSFGLWSGGPTEASAIRSFSGTFDAGSTFSLDIAVNFRNGGKGIDLRDGSNATIFNFNIGGDDYVVSGAATGNGSIGNAYDQNTAFHIVFTQLTLGGGSWTITRSGGVSDSDSGTYSGQAASFKLYANNFDASGTPNNLAFNNLAVTLVPEPSTIGLVGLGLIGAWFLRRRKA